MTNGRRTGSSRSRPSSIWGKTNFFALGLRKNTTEIDLGRVFTNHLIRKYLAEIDITKEVCMAKTWLAEMVNREGRQGSEHLCGFH